MTGEFVGEDVGLDGQVGSVVEFLGGSDPMYRVEAELGGVHQRIFATPEWVEERSL